MLLSLHLLLGGIQGCGRVIDCRVECVNLWGCGSAYIVIQMFLGSFAQLGPVFPAG